ncbi:MAG: sigma-70 family RNA polymerase sigma factor [Spirochaetales bacterium]|nr:sigma-70 family RNA polymerase sigma factor [Spirochaetales bacterium]
MDEIKSLGVFQLKENCQEQTRLFYAQKNFTTSYCYELFRRFFEDNDQSALSALYTIYRPQLIHWIKNHKYFHQILSDEDEIAIDSLSHFIFALKRHQFSDFANIPALLAYWRICVHSVISLQWRKTQKQQFLHQQENKVQEDILFENQMLKAEVWQRIQKILPSEEDQRLAKLIFVYNMRPRHIAKDFSETWADPNSVRVAQQRIKRQLQKDDILLKLLKDLVE